MKKKTPKTYVLTVSVKFPSDHKRKGQNTRFIEHILDETKKHTIRRNYELWKKRILAIQKGDALLSIRYWSGKPYCSNQVEFLQLTGNQVGIQKLEHPDNFVFASIENKTVDWGVIAKNDGLSFEDFCDWFKVKTTEPMAIIHFTNFRY